MTQSALIHNGIVVQIEASQFPVGGDLSWEDYDEGSVTVVIGYTFDGTDFANPMTLELSKDLKKKEIEDQKDAILFADLTITLADASSVTVDVNEKVFYSLQNFIESGITYDNFILADNTTVDFVTEDFVTFRDALNSRRTEFYQARKRKDAVIALTSVEDVESYDITTIYA